MYSDTGTVGKGVIQDKAQSLKEDGEKVWWAHCGAVRYIYPGPISVNTTT